MKFYISGRITGLEYQEAYKKFEDAEVEVKNMGGVPVNPMKLEHKPDADWHDFMEKDINKQIYGNFKEHSKMIYTQQ